MARTSADCGFPSTALGTAAQTGAIAGLLGLRAADRRKLTFSRRGRLAGHEGRQKTPVLETAKTKAPSKELSRSTTACQRRSAIAVGMGVMIGASISDAASESIALVVMGITIGWRRGAGYPNVAVELFLGCEKSKAFTSEDTEECRFL